MSYLMYLRTVECLCPLRYLRISALRVAHLLSFYFSHLPCPSAVFQDDGLEYGNGLDGARNYDSIVLSK